MPLELCLECDARPYTVVAHGGIATMRQELTRRVSPEEEEHASKCGELAQLKLNWPTVSYS